MTRYAVLLATALTLPGLAFAAGSTPSKPAKTETTATCPEGYIYNAEDHTCIAAEQGSLELDRDTRILTARELAHFGRPADALTLLSGLEADAEVLTLKGFATRLTGDWDEGLRLYQAALALDPAHWQAMSYMGQGFVEQGMKAEAREQLDLIRVSGGRGTWAEESLAKSLETGTGYTW